MVNRGLGPIGARDRLECVLARIGDPSGEGERTFLTVYPEAARRTADAADRRASDGTQLGPLDGVIVSIKDLFDIAGEPTRAGSTILADAAPATEDAPVVARLRAAGAVIVGKTNMAVIDEQRDAALRGQAGGDGGNRVVARRRGLDDLPIAVEGETTGCDQHLALSPRHMLAHGQRIEEFVGDQEQRLCRELADTLMPMRISQRRLLHLAQHGAGFH